MGDIVGRSLGSSEGIVKGTTAGSVDGASVEDLLGVCVMDARTDMRLATVWVQQMARLLGLSMANLSVCGSGREMVAL